VFLPHAPPSLPHPADALAGAPPRALPRPRSAASRRRPRSPRTWAAPISCRAAASLRGRRGAACRASSSASYRHAADDGQPWTPGQPHLASRLVLVRVRRTSIATRTGTRTARALFVARPASTSLRYFGRRSSSTRRLLRGDPSPSLIFYPPRRRRRLPSLLRGVDASGGDYLVPAVPAPRTPPVPVRLPIPAGLKVIFF
jgi:hypothetical protein